MFKKEGEINDAIIENMLSWRHSGFHVYIGDTWDKLLNFENSGQSSTESADFI